MSMTGEKVIEIS